MCTADIADVEPDADLLQLLDMDEQAYADLLAALAEDPNPLLFDIDDNDDEYDDMESTSRLLVSCPAPNKAHRHQCTVKRDCACACVHVCVCACVRVCVCACVRVSEPLAAP